MPLVFWELKCIAKASCIRFLGTCWCSPAGCQRQGGVRFVFHRFFLNSLNMALFSRLRRQVLRRNLLVPGTAIVARFL